MTPLERDEQPAAPANEGPDEPPILVRFPSTALAEVFTLVGASPYPDINGRCGMDPADYSIVVPVLNQADAEFGQNLGGAIYTLQGDRYMSLAGQGSQPRELDLSPLHDVPLPWLAGHLVPRSRLTGRFDEVLVATTAALVGRIVRQCQRSGAEITVSTMQREPLVILGDDDAEEAVLIRIRTPRGMPAAVLTGFIDLPGTMACREAGRLFIDIRFELPVSDAQLVDEVPANEHWLVGGADVGSWRIIAIGPEISPVLEFDALPSPAGPVTWMPPGQRGRTASDLVAARRLKVQIVPAAHPDSRTDAVLLDDWELDRLKRFLARSPLAETAFLIPGPGRHLLTEPGGLLAAVPYGVPVHRIGPGGLYLEASHQLTPPVPSVARPEVFGLDGETVIVLCTDGTWRLSLSRMAPAWSLWIGTVPELSASGLSERGRQLLAGLGTGQDSAPVPGAASGGPGLPTAGLDRARLLDEAARLEQRGRLGEAARRLEESGDLYRAAILYERAARETGLEHPEQR